MFGRPLPPFNSGNVSLSKRIFGCALLHINRVQALQIVYNNVENLRLGGPNKKVAAPLKTPQGE